MESKGKVISISRDMDGAFLLTMALEDRQGLETLNKETDYRIKLSKWTEKRSLNANSYFHVLCDKLRQAIGASFAYTKNMLISSYGQIHYLPSGEQFVYKTTAPPEFIYELEEPHLRLAKTVTENEKEVYFYRVYRGSHTYDSSEMAKLIDGAVMECKQVGIETLPKEELERMLNERV